MSEWQSFKPYKKGSGPITVYVSHSGAASLSVALRQALRSGGNIDQRVEWMFKGNMFALRQCGNDGYMLGPSLLVPKELLRRLPISGNKFEGVVDGDMVVFDSEKPL